MKNQISKLKMQIKAGEANPGPPIGPILGSKGINIVQFCKNVNSESLKKFEKGCLISIIVNIFKDKTFSIEIKTEPTSEIIKKVLNLKKGSSKPNKEKVSTINLSQINEVIIKKKSDLFVKNTESAIKVISGTAKSMGIEVVK